MTPDPQSPSEEAAPTQEWWEKRAQWYQTQLAARDAALQAAQYVAKLYSENYATDYEREKQRAEAAEAALTRTVQALQALDMEMNDVVRDGDGGVTKLTVIQWADALAAVIAEINL
jgi:hypothetical protein